MGEQKNQKTQDVNQLLKIRRDKLAELQADGKDPFQITKFDVTVFDGPKVFIFLDTFLSAISFNFR